MPRDPGARGWSAIADPAAGRPAAGYRWTAWLFALTGTVEAFAFGHLAAFGPAYLRQLGVPEEALAPWTGLTTALGFVVGLPLLPFWGVWAERYGRKLIIVRSAYLQALMFALLALSRDPYQFAAARALTGLVLGNTGVMLALQAEITPRERLGRTVGLIAAGPPVGASVGPLLGGYLGEGLGLRGLLALDAALAGLVGVVLTVALREPPRRQLPAGDGRLALVALRDVLVRPGVNRLFGLYFLVALGIHVAQPFLPLRIEQLLGRPAPLRLVGALSTAAGLVMAAATPLWGRRGDARGPLPALRLAILGTGLALWGQAAAGQLPAFVAWRLLQGCCQGGVVALVTAALAVYAPAERRASLLNLSLLPMQLSWFLGPLLGGGLALAGLQAVFAAAGLLALAGGVLAAAWPERSPAGDRPAGFP